VAISLTQTPLIGPKDNLPEFAFPLGQESLAIEIPAEVRGYLISQKPPLDVKFLYRHRVRSPLSLERKDTVTCSRAAPAQIDLSQSQFPGPTDIKPVHGQ